MGPEPTTFVSRRVLEERLTPNRQTSRFLKPLAKAIFGGGLLIYVLRSGMIDFKSLGPVLFAPRIVLTSLAFLSLSAFICALRWYCLASVQGIVVSFRQIFELTMIGNFFNTFLPGSVGGDLIKAWYIAGHSTQSKARGIFTVLLDRLIGLSVIIFYAAVTLFFFPDLLRTQQRLQIVGYTLWSFTGVSILMALLFFTPYLWKKASWSGTLRFLDKLGPLGRIAQAILLYRHHPRTVAAAIALSAVSIFGITLLYSFHGKSLGIPLATSYYFFVVPMGIVASAFPLLPGGIGVGQFAFFTLFHWVGETPEHGGTLCTLLQLHTILFNCVGLIFYLKYKRLSPLDRPEAK